jgi:hypothetical protein
MAIDYIIKYVSTWWVYGSYDPTIPYPCQVNIETPLLPFSGIHYCDGTASFEFEKEEVMLGIVTICLGGTSATI